jgi:DNA-binding NarL/FixJ family response regulator
MESANPARNSVTAIETLSPRDLDVLRAIRSGSSSGAIARALGISLSTVRRHVARILIRLDDPPRVVGANGSSKELAAVVAPKPSR